MSSVAADISPAGELQTLLASRVPLVVIESREEGRVIELVRDAALRAQRGRNWGVFQWTVTDGLLRVDVDLGGAQRTLSEPEQLLRHVKATTMAGIYVLLDFHHYLDKPLFIRTLKDIAQDYEKCARTLVLVSAEIKLPAELEHLAARFAVRLPDKKERHTIVMRAAREWAKTSGAMPRIDVKAIEKLVDNLAGLALHDVERLTRQAVFNDGALTEDDLKPLLAAKYQLLNRGGTLSFEADTARFADIGGLKNLRRWILQRKAAFDGSAPGLDAPKGVLLLGVQGCGKSLAARAAAGVLGVPLVRLDFGALYSKWHGESEKNLRESLTSAEALAPCVLWLDEIEKALVHGRRGQRHLAPRAGRIPHLAGRAARARVHRGHRQRHHGAAAGAGSQGSLRRDLLRRSAHARRARRDPRHSLQEARHHALGQRHPGAGDAQRRIFGRGDRAGRGLRAVHRAFEPEGRRRAPDRRRARGHQAAVRGDGRENCRAARLGRRAYRPRRLRDP